MRAPVFRADAGKMQPQVYDFPCFGGLRAQSCASFLVSVRWHLEPYRRLTKSQLAAPASYRSSSDRALSLGVYLPDSTGA